MRRRLGLCSWKPFTGASVPMMSKPFQAPIKTSRPSISSNPSSERLRYVLPTLLVNGPSTTNCCGTDQDSTLASMTKRVLMRLKFDIEHRIKTACFFHTLILVCEQNARDESAASRCVASPGSKVPLASRQNRISKWCGDHRQCARYPRNRG